MAFMAVPETALHKQDGAIAGEDQIGLSWQ